MTSTKYTPGPWDVGSAGLEGDWVGIYSGPNEDIVVCHVEAEDVSGETALANAHLIAAGPELYDTLKAIVDCYGVGWRDPANFVGAVQDFIDDARKALAKAGGASA